MIIPNVFGDKGKPFYNSVVATFCYQITHGEEPKIIDDKKLDLIFINRLIEQMTQKALEFCSCIETVEIEPVYSVKVSEVLSQLNRFKSCYYKYRMVPKLADDFERDLYNTFITYMDEADFEQKSLLHSDERGTLFEFVRHDGAGQVFFSTTKPGVTRGNHYHTRKMEKFCVVKGTGLIKMRRIGTNKVIEYEVNDQNPSSVEMPVFYTHNITNTGKEDMLTIFWTNEVFDSSDPDTFYEEI
jgi:UDP-2-acetamido-2,6-beta-L-arabino-hexul-4-ose reductase